MKAFTYAERRTVQERVLVILRQEPSGNHLFPFWGFDWDIRGTYLIAHSTLNYYNEGNEWVGDINFSLTFDQAKRLHDFAFAFLDHESSELGRRGLRWLIENSLRSHLAGVGHTLLSLSEPEVCLTATL